MTRMFDIEAEKLYREVLVLRKLVGERILEPSPCPYLLTQLEQLTVFGQEMISKAIQLKSIVKKECNHV